MSPHKRPFILSTIVFLNQKEGEYDMKTNKTELVFIVDRSGSMSGLERDTIGGYNSLLDKQRLEEGSAIVTTVLFDDKFELLHDRMDIHAISPISEKDYFVRGSTALLDAIGKTINKIGNVQKHTKPEMRADKVLVIITTDGMENSSVEYSYDRVKMMIERQKNMYGWEFIFLGANIDALATAHRFGIDSSRATNYRADSQGTHLNYATLNKTVSKFRSEAIIDDDWKAEIDKDFKEREDKKKN
jgi:uncharacterized protein YegL